MINLQFTKKYLPKLKIKNCKLKISKRGFSLVEFIVYFAVIGAVITISIQLITQMLRISERNRVTQEVQDNMRLATSRFAEIVREAAVVCDPPNSSASTTTAEFSDASDPAKPCSSDVGETSKQTKFRIVQVGGDHYEFQMCGNLAAPTPTDCPASPTWISLTNDRVNVDDATFSFTCIEARSDTSCSESSSSANPTIRMRLKIKYKTTNDLLEYELETYTNVALQP